MRCNVFLPDYPLKDEHNSWYLHLLDGSVSLLYPRCCVGRIDAPHHVRRVWQRYYNFLNCNSFEVTFCGSVGRCVCNKAFLF